MPHLGIPRAELRERKTGFAPMNQFCNSAFQDAAIIPEKLVQPADR